MSDGERNGRHLFPPADGHRATGVGHVKELPGKLVAVPLRSLFARALTVVSLVPLPSWRPPFRRAVLPYGLFLFCLSVCSWVLLFRLRCRGLCRCRRSGRVSGGRFCLIFVPVLPVGLFLDLALSFTLQGRCLSLSTERSLRPRLLFAFSRADLSQILNFKYAIRTPNSRPHPPQPAPLRFAHVGFPDAPLEAPPRARLAKSPHAPVRRRFGSLRLAA
jgi:hypothetical protein